MLRSPLALLVGVVSLLPVSAFARPHRDVLVNVISPAAGATVSAHPFVNVVLRFEPPTSCSGTVDPKRLRVRVGRTDVTPFFDDETVNGNIVGVRARIGASLLKAGRMNRLRVTVGTRACRDGKGHFHYLRDRVKVRFQVGEHDDQAPVAVPHTETSVVLPRVAVQFDGSQSTDAEGDTLTYHWTFGDGGTADGVTVTHAFTDTSGDVTATLVVNDGQKDSAPVSIQLAEAPPFTKPDATPGVLSVAATGQLEFAVVNLGDTATRTFTITNTDTTDTSELPVLLAVEPPFSIPPEQAHLDLGPGEHADVTVTFTPTAAGHHQGIVVIVANAVNRKALELLTHGYGGAGGDTGPTLAAEPLYFVQYEPNRLGFATWGILPDGTRFFADNTVHSCVSAGPGLGDLCVSDADCAANNGTCSQTSDVLFEPIKMCGDGEGGLWILTDSGTFSDPRANPLTELDASLGHVTLDAQGNRTNIEIVSRVNTQTAQIACDRVPARQGGRIFMAEFNNINAPASCFRDAKESLVAISKSSGNEVELLSRIDAVEGLDACNDDIDNLTDLEVTRDGARAFASFSTGTGTDNGALWLIRPTPSYLLHDLDDTFIMHPDGAILYATATDVGTRGIVSLYKIYPDEADAGALRLQNLVPCATFELPNNRPPGQTGRRTVITGPIAAGAAAPGSTDATVFVNVASSAGTDPGHGSPLTDTLQVRTTIAFSAPAGSSSCTPLGLINLEFLDQLTF